MQIRTKTKTFLAAFENAAKATQPRGALPILAHTLIEVQGSTITLAGSDLEAETRVTLTEGGVEDGTVCVPAAILGAILRDCPTEEIELTVDAKFTLHITYGEANFHVKGLDGKQFPERPDFKPNASVKVPTIEIRKLLDDTRYCASENETRYNINSVMLGYEDGILSAIATDSRRLSTAELLTEKNFENTLRIILSTKNVDTLLKSLPNDGELTIEASERHARFYTNSVRVACNLINGTFPDCRPITDRPAPDCTTVNRDVIIAALHRSQIVSGQAAKTDMRIITSKGENKLEIKTTSSELGEVKETIPATSSGVPLDITINPEHILEAIEHIDGNEITIKTNNNQGQLKIVSPTNPRRLAVMSTIRRE